MCVCICLQITLLQCVFTCASCPQRTCNFSPLSDQQQQWNNHNHNYTEVHREGIRREWDRWIGAQRLGTKICTEWAYKVCQPFSFVIYHFTNINLTSTLVSATCPSQCHPHPCLATLGAQSWNMSSLTLAFARRITKELFLQTRKWGSFHLQGQPPKTLFLQIQALPPMCCVSVHTMCWEGVISSLLCSHTLFLMWQGI